MSAKPGSWLFVIVCLFVCLPFLHFHFSRQTPGQTVICWAVNHHWSDRADKHSDRSVARPPKTTWERAGMYSPLHCGFASGGKSADSLTHRTLWGWGMWRSEDEGVEGRGGITFGNHGARSWGVCESQPWCFLSHSKLLTLPSQYTQVQVFSLSCLPKMKCMR